MINNLLTVMSRPITFMVLTLFSVIITIYAILTVEMLDLIRLYHLAAMNVLLIGVQLAIILLHRIWQKLP